MSKRPECWNVWRRRSHTNVRLCWCAVMAQRMHRRPRSTRCFNFMLSVFGMSSTSATGRRHACGCDVQCHHCGAVVIINTSKPQHDSVLVKKWWDMRFYFYNVRKHMLSRLAGELGYNVLQTDTDVAWFANPFPALKAGALGEHQLVIQPDLPLANAGVMYAQRIRPTDAAAWVLRELITRIRAFSFHPELVPKLLPWARPPFFSNADEQSLLNDCLASSISETVSEEAISLRSPQQPSPAQNPPFVPPLSSSLLTLSSRTSHAISVCPLSAPVVASPPRSLASCSRRPSWNRNMAARARRTARGDGSIRPKLSSGRS